MKSSSIQRATKKLSNLSGSSNMSNFPCISRKVLSCCREVLNLNFWCISESMAFKMAEILDFKQTAFIFMEQWGQRRVSFYWFPTRFTCIWAFHSLSHYDLFNLEFHCGFLLDLYHLLFDVNIFHRCSYRRCCRINLYFIIEEMRCNMGYLAWFWGFNSIYCFLPISDHLRFRCISYFGLPCCFHQKCINFCFKFSEPKDLDFKNSLLKLIAIC